MRTQKIFTVSILTSLLLGLYGCVMDEETIVEEPSESMGFVNIQAELKQEINVSAGKQALGLEEILDDINVAIYANPNGSTSLVVSSNYRDLPPLIELPSSGDYFIIMTSSTVDFGLTGSFDSRFDKGSYGYQTEFSVTPGGTTTINATLQLLDIAVSIDYTEEVLANFPNIEAEVLVTGDRETRSLSWLALDDTRTGYLGRSYIAGVGYDFLISEGGNLVVNITAQSNAGVPFLVTKTYENAFPNEHYMITVSYATSGASINVTLGDEIIIEDEILFPG